MREQITELSYLAASVLFVLGIRSLTHPDKARRGMQLAAIGMLLAVCGTLMNQQIIDYKWIVGGLVVGVIIGYPLGMWVPTTALPQRIAASLSFGALASVLVGVSEYYSVYHGGEGVLPSARMAALGLEVLLGSLTVTGALMAFGKLQEVLPSRPITFKGQNLVNGLLFATAITLLITCILSPSTSAAFYGMIAVAAIVGVLMVIPIGGADMPVVVALLNSYCGLAAAATGFALGNSILIICGALDGASGFLLSILMSKAMNRSFANVLFGAFGGGEPAAAAATGGTALPVRAARDLRRGRRHPARVCMARDHHPRLRHGRGAGAAYGARTGRVDREARRGGEVRHPSGGRAHARPHECAACRGERAVRQAVRHG